jgi:hypothetical protein
MWQQMKCGKGLTESVCDFIKRKLTFSSKDAGELELRRHNRRTKILFMVAKDWFRILHVENQAWQEKIVNGR